MIELMNSHPVEACFVSLMAISAVWGITSEILKTVRSFSQYEHNEEEED